MYLPMCSTDYTDFYSSLVHAAKVRIHLSVNTTKVSSDGFLHFPRPEKQ
jgi:hypothetical protein